MRKIRFAAAAALGAVLTGGTFALTTGAATAMPTSGNQCNTADLNVSTSELRHPGDRLFQIEFAAKPGVRCQMAGTPADLVFIHNGHAQAIQVVEADPEHRTPVTVDEAHPAVAYLTAPTSEGPAPAGGIEFDLPSGGNDTPVATRWAPLNIDGPVTLGPVTAPVS